MSDENTNVDRGDDYTPPEDAEENLVDAEQEEDVDKDIERVEGDDAVADDDADDDADGEEDEPDRQEIRIPKSRFDEAISKERSERAALQRQNEELLAKLGIKKQDDILAESRKQVDELETAYEEALFEGKKDDAKRLRRDLTNARSDLTNRMMEIEAEKIKADTAETIGFNYALDSVLETYPALDNKHPDYDVKLDNRVATVFESMLRSGMRRVDALKQAVTLFVEYIPAKGKGEPKKLVKTRSVDSARKAHEAANKQPPDSNGVGKSLDSKGGRIKGSEISRLSDDEFEKLSEQELAELRGDKL